MRGRAETGYGFSLYSTPSESLCSRFCKLDAKQFGLVTGVTRAITLIVSTLMWKKRKSYDKIDFEQPYPLSSNGGFICYGEYPNMQHNLEALEKRGDYSYSRVSLLWHQHAN